jgi:HemY protein
MKILSFIILTLFVAAALALLALDNPGYVLIAREPWSIEMTLVVFVALLLLAVLGLYLLWLLLVRIWKTPSDVAHWRQRRKARRAHAALVSGLIHLAEGSWAKAEKQLLSGLHDGETPLLNYLAAACAAQEQGKTEKRDEYLSLAHQHAPEQGLAIGMLQAQLQFQARQYERALASLAQLRVNSPKHPHTLFMLATVYRELRDWESLANLIPDLRRAKAASAPEIEAFEWQAHRELLMLPPPARAGGVLKQAWNAVPNPLRHKSEFVALYARQLIAQEAMDECEALISSALERGWSDELARLYGLTRTDNPTAQLETAETWLQMHADNPELLLTLGRLARRNKLDGKARVYLERAVALRAGLEASFELAQLLEQAGERDQALDCYRQALERHGQETTSAVTPAASQRRIGGAA